MSNTRVATRDKVDMDRGQREVIRRKRTLIAEVLDFNATSRKEYMEVGLLVDDMLGEIQSERNEFGCIYRWLELLPMRGNEAFDKLIILLMSRGYTWLANEMYAELEYERGLLQVDEYVIREAGMLVHKHYGNNKNLAEVEKRELQKLLAERFQAAKVGYSRQTREIQHQLEDALSSKLAESGRMRDLIQRVHAYLRVERDRLNPSADSVIESLEEIVTDPVVYAAKEANDYGEVLGLCLSGLFNILSKELFEKEEHAGERKHCIELLMRELRVFEEKPVYHIDCMLEEVIALYLEKIAQANREADVSNKLAKSMEKRFNNLKIERDHALAQKEEQILQLEAEIIMKAGTILNLERNVLAEASARETVLEDLEKWKKRYDLVERTRRIGYYQGNYSQPHNGKYFRHKNFNNHALALGNGDNKDKRPSSLWRDITSRLILEDADDISLADTMMSNVFSSKDFKKPFMSKSGRHNRTSSRMSDVTLPPPIDDRKFMVAVRPNVKRSNSKKKEVISKSSPNISRCSGYAACNTDTLLPDMPTDNDAAENTTVMEMFEEPTTPDNPSPPAMEKSEA